MDAIDRYGQALVVAGQRRARHGLGRRCALGRVGLVPVVVLGLLLVAGVAFAASRLFATGAPVRPPYNEVLRPTSRFGTPIASSVQALPLSVPDPVSGPPWGMRFEQTTRGLGCVQIGRRVGGGLGVLGQDQEFHNDGRFHALPPGVLGSLQCADLDANGHAYLAAALPSTASAFPSFGCLPAGDPRLGREPGTPVCPRGEPRMLYYGLLGPDAVSVTFATAGGRHLTVPTIGSQGAYLVVTAPARLPTSITPSASPVPPVVRITYHDGHSCDTATSRPCPLVAYAPRSIPRPTEGQVASPVRFRLSPQRSNLISADFRARYPVNNIDSAYGIAFTILSAPGTATCNPVGVTAVNVFASDVTPGQRVRLSIELGSHCPGRVRVQVFYASQRPTAGLPGLEYAPPNYSPPGGSGVSRIVGSTVVRVR